MNKLLSLIAAFLILVSPVVPAFAQYGWWGRASSINSNTPLLVRDTCPDGDFSGSLYDDECDADSERLSEGWSIVDGYVFFDDNSNGSLDSNEERVAGATVDLLIRSTRENLGTDITNSRGYYEFVGVRPGQYTLRISIPDEVSFLDALYALFVPKASAQTVREVQVNVNEDGSLTTQNFAVERDTTNGVSSVDGGNMADDTTNEDDDMEEMNDEDVVLPTTPSTPNRDILNWMNPVDVNVPTQDTMNNNFVLPTSLPNTGASL